MLRSQGVELPLPSPLPPPPDPSASPITGNVGNAKTKEKTHKLLRQHVGRDGWRGVLYAFTRLRDAKCAEAAAEAEGGGMGGGDS
jgi:hypothetical protein